jgi:hypothetical protein
MRSTRRDIRVTIGTAVRHGRVPRDGRVARALGAHAAGERG